MPSCHIPSKKMSVQDLLEIPWVGLRPDVVLHPGPIDPDGQRSYVLEDPVRGNNFRLGYAEGELLYRLATESDPDAAAADLYATTTLRPSLEEIAAFIAMLQREGVAILPKEEVIRRETEEDIMKPYSESTETFSLGKLLQGAVFFRVPLLRPDAFLTRTLPYISWLWSPMCCWFYILCGMMGLVLTLQEIELYFSTVSYLFTPQGGVAFFLCLALLKTGHEFAHAYAVKALSPVLHVRAMGIFFIVFWPLLYTDTTDVWKISDRRRRVWVSAAGVLFELAVAGIALLMWAILPDGILRSLMFFLSGTSLLSSALINLNPFMRFDGYYVLMDLWGIDNLRPRAFAMLRHLMRRILFDWKGPAPEVHPSRRSMIVYGVLASLYRIFIAISIALAAYFLFFDVLPILALAVFAVEIWLFIIRPLWTEGYAIFKNRSYLGTKFRLALTGGICLGLCTLLCIPFPRFERLPCLLLFKGTNRIEAPGPGQLALALPSVGHTVAEGDLITRLEDDALLHEAQNARFDLQAVRVSIENLGTGGEKGAYRNWLLAEEKRLIAAVEKYVQAIAQMEIRAPANGRITDINHELYEGSYVAGGTWLFTIATPDVRELKAFVHENLRIQAQRVTASEFRPLTVSHRLASPGYPAAFREKSDFPAYYLPNETLLDFAGGPIVSVQDTRGGRPRDAHFAFTFDVQHIPSWLPHGMPSWIWVRIQSRSVAGQVFSKIWRSFTERNFF